jgi:hypothetical protein
MFTLGEVSPIFVVLISMLLILRNYLHIQMNFAPRGAVAKFISFLHKVPSEYDRPTSR